MSVADQFFERLKIPETAPRPLRFEWNRDFPEPLDFGLLGLRRDKTGLGIWMPVHFDLQRIEPRDPIAGEPHGEFDLRRDGIDRLLDGVARPRGCAARARVAHILER